MGAVTSTANDLIIGALRNLNVLEAGEVPNSFDGPDALQVINDLLESLSTDRLFVYTQNQNTVAWTPGQFQYTIGNPVQGTFTGYTTNGSAIITGITAALTITTGINSSGVSVGGTLTDIQAAIPAGATIVSFSAGTTVNITFTGAPTGTSATLNANWTQPTGLYLITFSDNETRSGTLTNGSTSVTWTPTLTGAPTAGGNQVLTSQLVMSVNATQTLTAADSITYTAPGNFAIARPLRIRPGFTRITALGNSGLDYWWDVISFDDYNEIGYKGVPGPWPYILSYQTTFPLGTIWIYPNPQQAGQVFLYTDTILADFATLNQAVSLPQGYSRALKKLLAIELAPEYGKNPSMELLRQANEARTFIKSLNEMPVKKMRFDSALMRAGGKDASFVLHGGFGSNL